MYFFDDETGEPLIEVMYAKQELKLPYGVPIKFIGKKKCSRIFFAKGRRRNVKTIRK
jgi:hypothetical protein